jgi:hypothetical protein
MIECRKNTGFENTMLYMLQQRIRPYTQIMIPGCPVSFYTGNPR